MLDVPVIHFMQTVPFFCGMASADIEHLCKCGTVHDYDKGSHIFLRGRKADYFYVIMSGWIKLYRDTQEGDEAILGLLTRHDTFGETAIFSGDFHPFSAQAVEKAKIVRIPADALRQRARSNVDIILRIMQSFAQQMNRLQLENEHLSVMSASQRVGCLLLQLSNAAGPAHQTIHLPYEKSLAASRLGMKAETFSRALAQLKDIGIKVSGDTVEVESVGKLVDFVCSDCSACNTDCQFSTVHHCSPEDRQRCVKHSTA